MTRRVKNTNGNTGDQFLFIFFLQLYMHKCTHFIYLVRRFRRRRFVKVEKKETKIHTDILRETVCGRDSRKCIGGYRGESNLCEFVIF